MKYIRLSILFYTFLFVPLFAFPQEEKAVVSFKDRLAFKTNAVDWLLTIPNLGVELDLNNSIYNKLTLNLSGRWNWNTSHNYKPSAVFNLWEIRPEVRMYWKTDYWKEERQPNFKERLFSRSRLNPRNWRRYYLGAYLSAANFSFKLSGDGLQGTSYGLGVSGGFGIPLYSYRGHYIDLELGGSLGFAVAKTERYRVDDDNNCYVPVAGSAKKMHFVPYPMPTDVRVAFVYRFTSIKDKYAKIDYAKIDARNAAKKRKQELKDSIQEARKFGQSDSLRNARPDSLRLKVIFEALERDSVRIATKKGLPPGPALPWQKQQADKKKGKKDNPAQPADKPKKGKQPAEASEPKKKK